MFSPGPYLPKGIPDILACYCGFFIAIELKKPNKYPTRSAIWERGCSKPQRDTLSAIRDVGQGIILATDNLDDIVIELNRIDTFINHY